MTIDQLIHDLASLLQVKLESEFDRNFEREGFFSEKWQRTRYGSNGHHTLIQSGALRRSIRSRLSGNEIEFVSDLPYSVIHNEGGRIRVTAKMKRFFWAKCMEAQGGMQRKKDGSRRDNQRNRQLSGIAEMYKRLALQKVGSEMVIPQRRFIGWNDEVARMATQYLEKHLHDILEQHPEIVLGNLTNKT